MGHDGLDQFDRADDVGGGQRPLQGPAADHLAIQMDNRRVIKFNIGL